MEEERDREEFKHVCKLCNKRYPSGKSLGGHMRSHVIANSRKAKSILNKNKAPTFDLDDDDYNEDEHEVGDHDERDKERGINNGGYGGGPQSGYGLRENPKKTWRVVYSSFNSGKQQQNQQENQQEIRVCKQCGKGFQSLKALCGHMSCHSEKDRKFTKEEDDNSWSSESHSDNNNNNNNNNNKNKNKNKNNFDCLVSSKRQTRSSLSRYRSLSRVDSIGGGSSSNNSGIDHLEQEEVAKCLMMLSRDSSGYRNCFNFAPESSDNNSVILDVGIGKRKDFDLVSKKIKQISDQKVNVTQEMDNSDSGYFENGAKELESDDSVDGFVRNYGFKKPKVDLGSGLLDSDENFVKIKENYDNNNNNNPQKGRKYECFKCNKTFKTHQALGGHIISHRNDENNFLKTQSCSLKTMPINCTKKGSGSKKIKGHKCPYCPKVFKSGQALGGHKRSHMIGGGVGLLEDKSNNPAPPPEPEHKHPIIDLNLPAPVEEESSGNSQFMAW